MLCGPFQSSINIYYDICACLWAVHLRHGGIRPTYRLVPCLCSCRQHQRNMIVTRTLREFVCQQGGLSKYVNIRDVNCYGKRITPNQNRLTLLEKLP